MANQFVERGRERQKLIAANRARRNENRQRRMEQRKDVANTAYVTRMQQRNARNAGADAEYVNRAGQQAMLYGESIGDYQDRRQGYMDRGAARDIGYIAARSPERVASIESGASRYVADSRLSGEKYVADADFAGRTYTADRSFQSDAIRSAIEAEKGRRAANATDYQNETIRNMSELAGTRVEGSNAFLTGSGDVVFPPKVDPQKTNTLRQGRYDDTDAWVPGDVQYIGDQRVSGDDWLNAHISEQVDGILGDEATQEERDKEFEKLRKKYYNID